jgi:hypothetical protein
VLVFIGVKWLLPRPGSDRPRLWDDRDFVRKEIKLALEGETLVLPLLVDGASMPATNDLPEDIRSLTERNALGLRHDRFDDDAENVLAAIFGSDSKIRLWDSKVSPLAKFGFSVTGAVAGLFVLGAAALIHGSIFGRPLAATISVPLTDLLIIVAPISGALFGFAHAVRRNRK